MTLPESTLVGVVSRRKFLETMSQPYSLELYLRRPVRVLLEGLEADQLRLPSTCSIDRAVRQALSRSPELLYEPIAVSRPDGSLRLLELHRLLLAQSQIFAQVNAAIARQKNEVRQYANSLEAEQAKVREYTARLQSEQLEVQRRNQMLELQGAKLSRQTKEIADLNDRFVRVGEHLSTEGKQTFAEMMRSVGAICERSEQILDIGQALGNELETVNNATQLIERVSQQVRHLSMQAALIANRSGTENSAQMTGFSYITREISSLGTQTFEASNQVNQVANRFRFQIEELTAAAREGETVARSLAARSQQTQAGARRTRSDSRRTPRPDDRRSRLGGASGAHRTRASSTSQSPRQSLSCETRSPPLLLSELARIVYDGALCRIFRRAPHA